MHLVVWVEPSKKSRNISILIGIIVIIVLIYILTTLL